MKYPLVSAWHLVITAGFFVFQVENTLHERHIVILKLFSAKVQKHVGGSNYNQWYIFATTKCSKTPLSNSNVSNKGKSNFELSLWLSPNKSEQDSIEVSVLLFCVPLLPALGAGSGLLIFFVSIPITADQENKPT